jgi:hypothetical protein
MADHEHEWTPEYPTVLGDQDYEDPPLYWQCVGCGERRTDPDEPEALEPWASLRLATERAERAEGEVERLRAAIEKHQAAHGHGLCWENDVELWGVLGGAPTYPHGTVPPREEFLARCEEYWRSRQREAKDG